MNATRKVKLKDIKVNLTCKLCLGYLVDATTIIECLHSFCKSCIITYLEKSEREEKYCPVCDVQLHSTKPFTSIRSDYMLQEIVYKLVPGLFKNEMRRRREFYNNNGDAIPANPLDSGQVFDELYITSDDPMDLTLEYVTDDEKLRDSTKRYLRCPAAVSIFVLKKLLHAKYDLDVDTDIDIMFGERILPDDFLLMDVAYKYSWTKNGNKPLSLRYRIRGHSKPVMKPDKAINDTAPTPLPVKTPVQEESQTPQATKKKVCNENGSNIMHSEGIRPTPTKIPPNGMISGELAITPIKASNEKIKGRKRKSSKYSDIVINSKDDIKNLAKRLKLEKSTVKTQIKRTPSNPSFNAQTQMEIIPIHNGTSSNDSQKDMKEVQLHISENGEVSVQSVSSNKDDKIVYDLGKRVSSTSTPTTTSNSNTSPISSQDVCPTEKLLLSGNFYSKTGPSGVTEIICNKPDPGASSMKPSSAKPGYVTLNIPTPKIPISGQNVRIQSNLLNGIGGEASDRKKLSLDHNDSGAKTSDRTSGLKSDILEKIKQRISTNVADAATTTSNPIAELRKLSSNSATNTESRMSIEQNRLSGRHSLPIIAPLSGTVQHHHEKVKPTNGSGQGIGKDAIYPLNLSPKLGISMSIIPCITTASPSTTTNCSNNNFSSSGSIVNPLKKAAQHNSVVNGSLKFSKSPKLILPKTNNEDHDATPKKPPKFFKSRQSNSSSMSPSPTHKQAKYSAPTENPKHDTGESMRKSPLVNGNGTKVNSKPSHKRVSKERKDQTRDTNPSINSLDFLKLLSSGMMTVGAHPSGNIGNLLEKQTGSNSSSNDLSTGLHTRPSTYQQSQVTDTLSLSHHLMALNNLTAANNATDPLNSGLGIAAVAAAAAAAANCNGLPVGMMPFITDNYCSLPFLNQRHPLANFPYGYATPVGGFQGSITNLTTATTTPVNSSKAKSSVSTNGNNGAILNGLLTDNAAATKDTGSTLDLSMAKNSSQQSTSVSSFLNEKGKESNPLLVSILNAKSISPPESEIKNSKTTPPKVNETANNSKPEKAKSPIIRQLLQKREEKSKAHALSPQKTSKESNGPVKKKVQKSPQSNGNSSCSRPDVKDQVNGTKEKIKNNSSPKPDVKADSKSNNLTEPKSFVPTNSPKLDNDSDSNISSSTKMTLDKEKFMCLSAQNNNIETMSSNHDKSHDSITKNDTNTSLDCTNSTKSNKNSESNVPSAGTELNT